jgi:CheY-specific phosphatase CheX
MVAGNFKNKISGMGDGCMLSVPTVITGGDYSCHSLGSSSALRIDFLFDRESVLIVLEIQA